MVWSKGVKRGHFIQQRYAPLFLPIVLYRFNIFGIFKITEAFFKLNVVFSGAFNTFEAPENTTFTL